MREMGKKIKKIVHSETGRGSTASYFGGFVAEQKIVVEEEKRENDMERLVYEMDDLVNGRHKIYKNYTLDNVREILDKACEIGYKKERRGERGR